MTIPGLIGTLALKWWLAKLKERIYKWTSKRNSPKSNQT